MLNRRHIRIKVMQVLFAFSGMKKDAYKLQSDFLDLSMSNMYDLYLLLISLLLEVHLKAEDYIKKIPHKHLPTLEDLNPNKKFVNNALLVSLQNNKKLKDTLENHKIFNWKNDDEYVDLIFREILSSKKYKDYLSSNESSFEEDRNFIAEVYKSIIAPNAKIYNYLEDKNLTWLDDFPVVNTVLVKLLRKIHPNSSDDFILPPLFRDKDDNDFANNLLFKTTSNLELLAKEIALKTTNWDIDRIATLDFILLQMAICEIKEFQSIPVKVTLNEYIEIAKEYSTPKSNVFINGILDNFVREYEAKGKLKKTGRGLI